MKKRFYKDSVFYEPDPPESLGKLVDMEVVNRCPQCRQVWSKGQLSEGTALEIECRRCKLHIIEIVPYSGK